mgnify:CR=1 FL=1
MSRPARRSGSRTGWPRAADVAEGADLVARRHARILDLARRTGSVAVETLAAELEVTPQTIRRDLNLLARRSMLSRVHGGAIVTSGTVNPDRATRREVAAEAKAAIGAAAAANRAIAEGAQLILGPLLAEDVRAVSPIARRANVPLLSFSNDVSVAGNGTYVMGYAPAQAIGRVVSYARGKGVTTFGGLVPNALYGSRASTAFLRAVEQAGGKVVSLQTYDRAPAALGAAVQAVRAAATAEGLPESIALHFTGASGAYQKSLSNQVWLIIAAVVCVYIVLGVLYESYVHPLTILSTLPSAGVGALLALWITGHSLDVVGIIGLVLLIGIVKKNAIMMIDFAIEAERGEGKSPQEAIHQAALMRFRPILMTTLAALAAALPLMFSFGDGAELRRPLGIAIFGGLVLSQLLTLFTTPVIYLWFDRLGQRFGGRSGSGSEAEMAS